MGYIYKISNDINNKVYIGQTSYTTEWRWYHHTQDGKRLDYKLYRAMNKYGIEHFFPEEIEKCEDKDLDEREIFWIAYYDSYNNGYNSNRGGKGNRKYDHEKALELWEDGYPIIYIAKQFGAHPDIIGKIIRSQGITKEEIFHRGAGNNRKIIGQYDKNGNLLNIFPSGSEAARQTGNAQGNISKCCLGKTKTCGGYVWKYIDEQFSKEEKYELLKKYLKKNKQNNIL